MGTMQQMMNTAKECVKLPVNRLWSNKKTLVEWKHNERVEVQAFAGSTMVELGENKTKCTPVMVRVAAPAREQQPPPCTPVDVVAVLNTSKSMQGMETKMKEAIMAVINKLEVNDRLSLVTLEEHKESSEEMELVEIRGESDRATAVQKIESITKRSWSSTECSVTLSDKALQRVVTQMKKTKTSEERHRCVMLLSCVQDQVDMKKWITEVKTHEFQLHTFDLSAQQHDAGRFRCLVDQRAGTYHYFANNTSITEAFGNFVGSLKTVVATSVRVSVSLKAEAAQQGFSILPVETGGHCGSGEHHIHIADMHAGEHKSFMVYLQQNAHQEVTTATVNKILSVNGWYRPGCATSSQDSPLPCLLHGKEITMKKEVAEDVAAEVVRSMIVKQVKEIIVKEEIEVKTTVEVQQEQKTTTETHHHLIVEKEWKKIQELAVYKEARSTTLVKHIEKDVAEMVRTSSEGRLHMMSWLSCHWWQHTTCTTMSHYTESFTASSSKTMMLVEDNRSAAPWWMWVVGVLLLVLMVILLGRFLYNRRRWPVPAVRPTALDVVGKHPQWPTMVSDLDVVLKTAKEDKIISFFKEKGASPRDMNQQIDQYLYMAILYASVLRARYDGTSAFSEEVVRRHAEMYIQSMLTRTKRGALPFLQVSSTEAMTKTMSQYLYSTIVQTEVLVTIRPPEDIIIEPSVHPEIIERDRKIKDLQKENDRLREEIAKLRKERDSCCQRANDCEKANANYNGWGSP